MSFRHAAEEYDESIGISTEMARGEPYIEEEYCETISDM
jgi:hypothetical protein